MIDREHASSLAELLDGQVELASPPDFFIRLNALVEDPRASASDIGAVIAQDPAMTAQLLRIANSPVYGFAMQIDSISRAISTIGTRGLRDLVLASSAVSTFSSIEAERFDWRGFWRHSLLTATLSRLLGKRARLPAVEALFVAGLLHDIGLPVIARRFPGISDAVQVRADHGETFHAIESELLGSDHAMLACGILEGWSLPETILEPVACHHDASRAERYRRQSGIVQIADLAASGTSEEIPEGLWLEVGLSPHDLESELSLAHDQIDTLYGLFVSRVA